MKIRIVTFNGPMKCGKSWVCDRLPERFPNTRFERVSFQDALARGTLALLGLSPAIYGTDAYAEFKETQYYGRTGREWMIFFSESAKVGNPTIDMADEHPNIWTDVMLDSIRRQHFTHRSGTVYLADSNGFGDELDYLRGREDVDVLACSIEPPDSPVRGSTYPNDSRFNLAHKCAVVAEDSNLLLDRVSAALQRRNWV